MPTHEERLTTLEQSTTEYRPVLQNIAYELTMVKGLTIDQIGVTQELRQNMSDVKERLTRIEEQLNTILALLKPS
jgi:DNA repair exonuclease SbcCD ATPase subunit